MPTRPDAPSSPRLRLLFALDSFWPNIDGVAVSLDRLAWALAERGHAVSVLAPRIAGTVERPGPVTVQRLPALRWPGSAAHLALPLVRSHIRTWRPDLVVIALPFSIGLAALHAGRAAGLPVVGITSTMPTWLSARLPLSGRVRALVDAVLWRFLVACYQRCTTVVAVSRTALALLHRHGLTRPARVISNGVPLDTFRPRPRDAALAARLGVPAKPTVLYAGRLDADKRLDLLLASFALLRQRCDAHLLLVGDGGSRPALERRARRAGLANNVTFTGFLPAADYPRVFSLAAVFALASPAELQSIVALEALASGLPLVAVAAGALPELVEEGANGHLVPPDDPAALASALADLLSRPERRAVFAARSWRVAQAHDLRRTFDAYDETFSEVLRAAPGSASIAASGALCTRRRAAG